ncbi:MAG: hypothetical protein PHN82_12275 [bacterium]|nr:hypothetical protein [bacterium]
MRAGGRVGGGAGAALLRLKARIFINSLRAARREPALKQAVVASFVALWLAGGFCLTYEGMRFLGRFPGIGDYLVVRMLPLFTLAVSVMLLFSNGVLAYPVLFGRRENALLFSLPIPTGTIVSCKIWETAFLSSWAFLLMAVPLTLAYFLGGGMGARLFLVSWLFFMPLAAVCAAGGILLALTAGRLVARMRRPAGAAVVAALAAAALFAAWRTRGAPGGGDERLRFVNRIVAQSEVAGCFLLPSSWAADGILAVRRGRTGDALFFWALLVSTAAFARSAALALGEARITAAPAPARARPPARRRAAALIRAAGSPVRIIAAKDVVTFCRDPGQWGQFALFFGLLGIYILNLRNLPYDLDALFWRYLLFILNLSAMGFTLAGLCSRFFFPLMGMEIRQFWLLRPNPLLGPARILRGKFLLCLSFTVGVTGTLALLSGVMLRVSAPLLAASIACVACMGTAISGIAVGLGAVYPNPKASSSSEAVSGFGGTVVLLATTLYICGILFIQAAPLTLHAKGRIPDACLPIALAAGAAVTAALSAAVAALALRAGRRRLETMDF